MVLGIEMYIGVSIGLYLEDYIYDVLLHKDMKYATAEDMVLIHGFKGLVISLPLIRIRVGKVYYYDVEEVFKGAK